MKESVNVKINPKILLDACTELVTTNGRPLVMLEDTGFRKILDPILKGFGNTFSIN